MKDRIVVPKDSWKNIETLVREHPTMLASEIIAEYEYGKKCYEAWKQERDKDALALVKSLMRDKYFKIEYAGKMNLIYYIEVIKAWIEEGEVMCSIICSSLSNRSVVDAPDGLNIETLQSKTYETWTRYVTGVSEIETVTILSKDQYDTFLSTVSALFAL